MNDDDDDFDYIDDDDDDEFEYSEPHPKKKRKEAHHARRRIERIMEERKLRELDLNIDYADLYSDDYDNY
jgi:hypothetical protein